MSSLEAANSPLPKKFVQIDEEGYFQMDELRVADIEIGRAMMQKLSVDERGRVRTEIQGEPMFVEAFDEPYVVKSVSKEAETWNLQLPYGFSESFDPKTLCLDEWDRFHGRSRRGLPFVFSRAAQNGFFNQVESFDDESVTMDGQVIKTEPWLLDNPDADKESFWTGIYQNEEPRWELNQPAPALVGILPRLKLQASRILVLGAGSANDAAYLAEQGHFVTAVDISPEAIHRAKSKYGHIANLKFLQADLFQLPSEMNQSFDLIFEHTCYCAIKPSRRNELVRTWRRLLSDNGFILGVFFAIEKRQGPPFGGSEWEVRARLGKGFRSLYWLRWRHSLESRQGMELLVYAQKVSQS